MPTPTASDDSPTAHKVGSDTPFLTCFVALSASYLFLILAMLIGGMTFTAPSDILEALQDPNIQFSIGLTLVTCTVSAVASVIVAIPIGYLLSRYKFRGKNLIEAALDIPIVLPPLVIGLFLLIVFQTAPGKMFEAGFVWVVQTFGVNSLLQLMGLPAIRSITFDIPSVVLAQFAVACAFAVRTMRVTYAQIDRRAEDVALTLGCRRGQAFFRVLLPVAWPGVVSAGTLAWARAMGEFGPILVFAGTMRGRTEVMSSSVFLHVTIGNLEGAVAVSLLMVTLAVCVLFLARTLGMRSGMI
jgi:molybdate transport system permease protein